MDFIHIVSELERNRQVFSMLTKKLQKEEYFWKPEPNKWCLLEIMCHLADEEVEDFRARLAHVLTTPENPLPPADPVSWVITRKYIEQDFAEVCKRFDHERTETINWLKSLKDPDWNTTHIHPKAGPITAELFLVNWVEHDYLHFRQIITVKHFYLQSTTREKLDYAGKW